MYPQTNCLIYDVTTSSFTRQKKTKDNEAVKSKIIRPTKKKVNKGKDSPANEGGDEQRRWNERRSDAVRSGEDGLIDKVEIPKPPFSFILGFLYIVLFYILIPKSFPNIIFT